MLCPPAIIKTRQRVAVGDTVGVMAEILLAAGAVNMVIVHTRRFFGLMNNAIARHLVVSAAAHVRKGVG